MSYPWRLRLVHEGHSAIRVEREGPWFRFDPLEAPSEGEQTILTWAELERASGVVRGIGQGANPRVVASEAVRSWLRGYGSVQDQGPGQVGRVHVEVIEYQPIPYATGPEALRKTRAALLHPATAARRLLRRTQTPSSAPLVVQLTFADGTRLLHLNCSLHEGTPDGWLDQAVARFAGAEQVIAGVDFEAEEAFERRIGRFEPGTLLVADLVNDTRAGLGLPVRHLTPLVDRLRDEGVNAYPFVSGAAYRFE